MCSYIVAAGRSRRIRALLASRQRLNAVQLYTGFVEYKTSHYVQVPHKREHLHRNTDLQFYRVTVVRVQHAPRDEAVRYYRI